MWLHTMILEKAKSTFRFLKQIAHSRWGHALVVLHLILVLSTLASKPALSPAEVDCVLKEPGEGFLLAGRSFHFTHETGFISGLFALNLPGILLGILMNIVIHPIFLIFPRPCAYTDSWIAAMFLLLGTVIQWQFIGYCVECIRKMMKDGES